ncbi:MAG: hypothetical protein KKD39_03730 [Candidatus Altiarchaeota archaeon]|nr:hypothetical protein [Candidatus Altiarchaeota archaeon]
MVGEEVKVVGVGGSGCAACERMSSLKGCDFIGVHTDAASLLKTRIPLKVLIGLDLTRGRSTGNNIRLGEEAAISDREKISSVLTGAKITFLIAGLGGGTGAGASPVVAEAAKSLGSTVIAFVNIPFTAEGKVCLSNAKTGLDNLRPYCDLIVLLENDRFLQIVSDVAIGDAFTKVNDILFEAVSSVLSTSLDAGPESIRPLLVGFGTLGHGLGTDYLSAVKSAMSSPLLIYDIIRAKGVLLDFRGPKDDGDVKEALDYVFSQLPEGTPLLWGLKNRGEGDLFESMALFTGFSEKIKLP